MPSYVLIWKVPTNQPTNRREREGDVCASVYTHSRVLAVPSFVINARNDDAEKTGDGPDLGVETMVFFFFDLKKQWCYVKHMRLCVLAKLAS
jgi:hypothetical protein